MGGGLMQLVAYGAQDVYLTGNPQITFFKVVYRRHTNFSMEAIQQTINGSSGVGTAATNGTVTISRNGDLVHKVYVTSSTASIEDGNEIVSQIDLEIGGQLIDRHTREWMQIQAELTIPESKASAYKNMIGSLSHGLNSTDTAGVGMVQIPLYFYFCRNPGLALPLIALQYHEVKLKCTWGTSGSVGAAASVQVWCDYIYLDTDERRRFAQVSHEYLIEQVQVQSAEASRTTSLNFNHPVKELIWTSNAVNTYLTARLTLNGHDRFANQEEEYFQLRQPIDYHTAVPGANIPMGDVHQPIEPIVIAYRDAGTATGTAVSTLHNTVSATSGTKTVFSLLIGTNFIGGTTASNYPKIGDLLDVEIRDIDEIATGNRRRNAVVQVTGVAAQTAGHNITVQLEDDNNAIATAFVVGTTVDDMVSISIIARLQNPLSRCSKFAKKINCYSFALKPEEHQPSGTCNFSRIDTAKLETGAVLEAGDNVYAVNYNVLRIMSGMGGLAYSN
jgi:hypothetical protein